MEMPPGLMALINALSVVSSGAGDENDVPYQDADGDLSGPGTRLAGEFEDPGMSMEGMEMPLGEEIPEEISTPEDGEGFEGLGMDAGGDPDLMAALQALLQGQRGA